VAFTSVGAFGSPSSSYRRTPKREPVDAAGHRDFRHAERLRWKATVCGPRSVTALTSSAKRITVAGYLARWLAHITPRVAPRTAQSYRGVVEGRLIPSIGATELSCLTALQISEAVTMWATGPRNDARDGTLSPRSVQLALVVLRMALTQGVKWNVVQRNVAEHVDTPRLERKEQAFISTDDLDRLFVEAEKSGMFAPIATAIGLGLRRAELLGLQWGDIDFERRTVSIARTLQRIDGVLTTKSPKTKLSRRTLVLPAFVLDALRAHRRSQAELRLALGLGNGGTDAWVFANTNGGPLDMDAFAKRFRRLSGRAGLPHVHLHSLRHGYAVLGLQAGIDLKTISSNLGHSSIRLTADLTRTSSRRSAKTPLIGWMP
jgi:integrase